MSADTHAAPDLGDRPSGGGEPFAARVIPRILAVGGGVVLLVALT
ncbi:hypothetical protein GA0070558_1677 [Micromonospora haikouensis]|uniref:Uncharacterized protein n=1 Tax=Micromonospora haikouensis TaxID=686309 RepID=A0A1C4YS54_9ACTN|nr:hypothetical protein GA0070558_1677 [Micromonospora haikouensis]